MNFLGNLKQTNRRIISNPSNQYKKQFAITKKGAKMFPHDEKTNKVHDKCTPRVFKF